MTGLTEEEGTVDGKEDVEEVVDEEESSSSESEDYGSSSEGE